MNPSMAEYDCEYAQKYIEGTLNAPYTVYKNTVIANVAKHLGMKQIWDLGGNVSGLMNIEGSLRFQLAKLGVRYASLDLSPAYFNRNFVLSLNRPEDHVYDQVDGIVGDIRQLPLSSSTISGMVCADVIEHINSPDIALSEMYRVLKPQGHAIIVVPSLYKLDAVKLLHILKKRFSTHENRLLVSEWVELLKQAGFSVDSQLSCPLGIASGLLYTAWLCPDYVPEKNGTKDKECFSPNAQLFHSLKHLVGKMDSQIDDFVQNNPACLEVCKAKFGAGDIKGVLALVEDWYNQVAVEPSSELHDFVSGFENSSISATSWDQLQRTIEKSNQAIDDNAFFGNSALLVLSK